MINLYSFLFIAMTVFANSKNSENFKETLKINLCADSTYLVEDEIKGFKIDKSYSNDSLIYALKDIASIDSFNMWEYSNVLSLFTDSCTISSKNNVVGNIQGNEILETIFTIDSCRNVNTLYKCYDKQCHQFLCLAVKVDNNKYRPIILNHLRFDEYPEPTKLYESNGNKIISVFSTISGNMGETKEYYFIERNDTLRLFKPWQELHLNEVKLADSICFKKQGYFNVKELTYSNYLWHIKDHYHWPTLGRVEIFYEIVDGKLKIKNYKIYEPTDEQKYWIERRDK